jgi:ABC-2 type transport system ATP-binding protein
MKVLLDLASADKGSAIINGRPYREIDNPTKTVGVVLEPNAFHPGRSGRNHLRIMATAAGISHGRVDEMLETVGLNKQAADRKVGAYSLGMKQRLSLAAAMLGDPKILVLDEPGNGLDPQGIHQLRDILRRRAAEGGTILVSSHLLSEIELLADDLVVINQGKLVATGSLSELQHTESIVRVASPIEFKTILENAGAQVELYEKNGLLVRGMELAKIGKHAHKAGIALLELSQKSDSLEKLFLELTNIESSKQPKKANKEVI